MATWYRETDFEEGYSVPYQVRLDRGDYIYAPIDDDDCIRRTAALPLPLRFGVGDRVKAAVDSGWQPGVISRIRYRDRDFHNGKRTVPYQIKLDIDNDMVYAPIDNDDFVMRHPSVQLRFKVGDRVDFLEHTKEAEWSTGTVTAVSTICTGRTVPYKIQPDNQLDEIFIHADSNDWIKKSTSPHICRGELNGMIHVMSKTLIFNEEYEAAEEMLQERIGVLRSKIKSKEDWGDFEDDSGQASDVSYLKVDLSNFLVHLSEVYQAQAKLDEMKEVLDEALDLIEDSTDDNFKKHRLLNVASKLAIHAGLSSDKHSALDYLEESIVLAEDTTMGWDNFRLGLMLTQAGKLNIACDNKERGLDQMEEGIDMLARLYGDDNKHVKRATEDLKELRGDSTTEEEDSRTSEEEESDSV